MALSRAIYVATDSAVAAPPGLRNFRPNVPNQGISTKWHSVHLLYTADPGQGRRVQPVKSPITQSVPTIAPSGSTA